MPALCIIGIVLFVLFALGLAYSMCVIAGKTDDVLEKKYGIRRS